MGTFGGSAVFINKAGISKPGPGSLPGTDRVSLSRSQKLIRFRNSAVALLAVPFLLAGCSSDNPAAPEKPTENEAPTATPNPFLVVGRGPVTQTYSSDLWVFQGVDGKDYAYTGTWGGCVACYGDRLYVWDVTSRSSPVLTDSVMVDARVVNDVKVNAAGTVAVMTREGASTRRNGIVVLDLADPAHPTVASEFTESLTGGVHNTFIDGDIVYAVHNGTQSLHAIDISDPAVPSRLGEYRLPGATSILHDVWVDDGIAYLSYWNDGLVILDVGNGIAGGSPSTPQLVSRFTYRTQVNGMLFGNTHVALPYTNDAGNRYVFVGDEIFLSDGVQREPAGYIHVLDVSDIRNPVEVAKYDVANAGAHNVWAHDDILYVAYYDGGLRAVDIAGTLEGDLIEAGREIGALSTTDGDGFIPDRAFTWGPQYFEGYVFASDHHSGLWVTELVF